MMKHFHGVMHGAMIHTASWVLSVPGMFPVLPARKKLAVQVQPPTSLHKLEPRTMTTTTFSLVAVDDPAVTMVEHKTVDDHIKNKQ
jgi:hypothetical protein